MKPPEKASSVSFAVSYRVTETPFTLAPQPWTYLDVTQRSRTYVRMQVPESADNRIDFILPAL